MNRSHTYGVQYCSIQKNTNLEKSSWETRPNYSKIPESLVDLLRKFRTCARTLIRTLVKLACTNLPSIEICLSTKAIFILFYEDPRLPPTVHVVIKTICWSAWALYTILCMADCVIFTVRFTVELRLIYINITSNKFLWLCVACTRIIANTYLIKFS